MSVTKIEGYNYAYITAGATTTISSKPCVLVRVVVNKALTGTVKLIDNTTGTTANIGTITNASGPIGSIEYGVQCGAGLIVINSATEDITVVWR